MSPGAAETAKVQNATAANGPERVLIVEDDAAARVGLEQLVRSWGFAAESASDGEEALARVTTFRPAIVISDLVMPRLGGLDAIPRILKLEPSMPIVVVTGHPSPRAVGELEHWAVPLLAKPVNLPHLEALITRSLGASGAA